MASTLRYEATDGVGVLTLDRPHCKNAIDGPIRTEMRELVKRLRYDRSAREFDAREALRLGLVIDRASR